MLIRRCQYASEAILIAMACLAPWAFGAVEAWAEFVLFLGIFVLALLGLVIRAGTDRARALVCLPSVAMAGLLLLAAFQTTPLAPGVLKRISPAAAALRADLVPAVTERVSGDEGAPVSAPATTISLEPEATQRNAIRLAAGWVLFQVVMGLGLGTAPLRRFGIALAGNAALLALFSLVQLLSWNGRIYWVRESPSGSSGPFVNHNHLAAYLNLGLGFALAFLMTSRRASRDGSRRQSGDRVWAAYAAGLIIVGVVASQARTGFLAMLVSAALLVAVLRPQTKRLVLGLGGIGLLVIVFLATLGSATGYQERIATILESKQYAGRMEIWRTVGRLVPAYPWWGTGFGSFAIAANRLFVDLGESVYEHAENEYIEWLLEGGIVGLGLVLAAVVGAIALGRRGLKSVSDPAEAALLYGAFFGVSSLLIQSLGDFALHVPAVAIVAVILGAHLAKLGLEAGRPGQSQSQSLSLSQSQDRQADQPAPLWRRGGSVLGALAMLALSATVLVRGVQFMQVESAMAEAGFFLSGVAKPAAGEAEDGMDELERKQDALQRVVQIRPNSADGYWRLGLIFLRLYSTSAEASLLEFEKDKEMAAVQANPLWLYSTVHSPPDGKAIPVEELLGVDHIRLYLVPAARCFLEARRCSPLMADPHARLATLDYLLQGGEPAKVYAERALRLAGSNLQILELVQGVAIQIGDPALLARCWNRILRLRPAASDAIAEMAAELFSAEEIRDKIVPSGQVALRFAERLYNTPESQPSREILLTAALENLPRDTNLKPADKLQAEARIWFLRNDREKAKASMEQALAVDPRSSQYRVQLVDWLLGWGEPRQAYDQAMIGLYYSPGDSVLQKARDRAADALAKTER